ncbi:hypothetical protein OAL01_02695 [Rubripirellula sp.]|nr:hypothetical protein [Rubripirellula sp.]
MTAYVLVETAFQASHFPVVDSDYIETFIMPATLALPLMAAARQRLGADFGTAALFKRTIATVLTRTSGTIATLSSQV